MMPSRGMGAISKSKIPKGMCSGGKMAKGGKLNIAKAIKKPGALHEQMGVPAGKKIPAKALAKAAKAPGKLGQRARFAQVLKGFKRK